MPISLDELAVQTKKGRLYLFAPLLASFSFPRRRGWQQVWGKAFGSAFPRVLASSSPGPKSALRGYHQLIGHWPVLEKAEWSVFGKGASCCFDTGNKGLHVVFPLVIISINAAVAYQKGGGRYFAAFGCLYVGARSIMVWGDSTAVLQRVPIWMRILSKPAMERRVEKGRVLLEQSHHQ